VCVSPRSWISLLQSKQLADGLRRLDIIQVGEYFDCLEDGAPIAYHPTFVEWVPMMGQMIRMWIEGEPPGSIPTRRPNSWQWGVNLSSLSSLGLNVSALPCIHELVKSIEG
jgi:hypothetical protein